jgi:hypothetical protein
VCAAVARRAAAQISRRLGIRPGSTSAVDNFQSRGVSLALFTGYGTRRVPTTMKRMACAFLGLRHPAGAYYHEVYGLRLSRVTAHGVCLLPRFAGIHGPWRARSLVITGKLGLAARAAACADVAVVPLMLTKKGERAKVQNERGAAPLGKAPLRAFRQRPGENSSRIIAFITLFQVHERMKTQSTLALAEAIRLPGAGAGPK